MEIPQTAAIREVCPRDGLQLEQPLAFGQKLQLIEALVRTGVRRIEATAFASPSAMPTMADAERVAEALPAWPGIEAGRYRTYSGAGLRRTAGAARLTAGTG